MIRNVEVNEVWAPQLIMIIIPVVLLLTVLSALILLKWRKQKQALAKSEVKGNKQSRAKLNYAVFTSAPGNRMIRLHFPFHSILFLARNREKKTARLFGLAAWIFALLGLVTDIVWAQIAWGSYWSWDPKRL